MSVDIFDHITELEAKVSDRLLVAVKNMEFVRRYTISLLEDLEPDDWYWTPKASASLGSPDSPGFVTHIAWQAGHIAMAQYGLTLYQQRGRVREVDAELMSGKFRKLFMRGTQPVDDRELYPEPNVILGVLKRVHSQALKEIPGFDGDQLDEPLSAPHAAFATRYGALLFVGAHEMVHAGQIGLLRRMMGKAPLREFVISIKTN